MKQLFVIGAVLFTLGIAGIVTTLFGVVRAFNDIAAKGNAYPAVVAGGIGDALIPASLGIWLMLIAAIVIARGAYVRRRKRPRPPFG